LITPRDIASIGTRDVVGRAGSSDSGLVLLLMRSAKPADAPDHRGLAH
jgi:hypothetical protein